jgi:hypothetical protein
MKRFGFLLMTIAVPCLLAIGIAAAFHIPAASWVTRAVASATAIAQTNRAGFVRQQSSADDAIVQSAAQLFDAGRRTFRFDTFGDEAFWGDALKLHQAIAGARFGGVGLGVSPAMALAAGLKVDVDAVPPAVLQAVAARQLDLNDPANTLVLLQANAVVGVTMMFDSSRRPTSMGIQCALCHSTVDDSVTAGIGHRLDGWPNRDLNVGAIVAAAPDLSVVAALLGTDQTTVRNVLNSWGPGKFDAELLMDGKAFRPDGRSAATLIPPAFGLAGVNLHTWTGWGSVTHWNAFVANLEMHGKGTFFDPRLNNGDQFPVAARAGFGNVRSNPDLITSRTAESGKGVFEGVARCTTCHVPPLFTEPGWNLHTPAEIGIDSFQADRAPDRRYRTPPLKGLFAHQKGGFYHDGRYATLLDVINHYVQAFGLRLTDQEKLSLVEYLKSL